jgi:hypothetical protein
MAAFGHLPGIRSERGDVCSWGKSGRGQGVVGLLFLTQCMDRLRFARENVRRKRKLLICIRLFDRLAGRGLDGNTHASLVSLADRLASNHLGHQTLDAFIDPFHALFSVAN